MVESRRTYSSFVEQMRQESLQRLDANQQEQVILINQLIEVSRNAQGQRGITPLMWQAAFGGESARNGLNALLRFTQDINQTDANGRTALMYAVIAENQNGSVACCEDLIRAGADINKRCQNGFSALDLACATGNVGAVEVLLRQGSNANQSYGVGATEITPLRVAIQNQQVDVVKLLLERGATVHPRDVQLLLLMQNQEMLRQDQGKARLIYAQLQPYMSQEMLNEAQSLMQTSDFGQVSSVAQKGFALMEVDAMRSNREKHNDSERDLRTENGSEIISDLGYTPTELRYILPSAQGVGNALARSLEDTCQDEIGLDANFASYDYVPQEVLAAIRLAQYDVVKGYENEEAVSQVVAENSALREAICLKDTMSDFGQVQETRISSVFRAIEVIKLVGVVAVAGGGIWAYHNPEVVGKYLSQGIKLAGQNSETIDRGIQNVSHLRYATSDLFREQTPEQLEAHFGGLLTRWQAVAQNTNPENYNELQRFLGENFSQTGSFGCNDPIFARNLERCYNFLTPMGYRFSDVFVRRDGTENIYSFDENRFREIENAHWTSFKESLREEGIEERTNEWNTRMQEEGSRLEEIERGFLNVTRKASLLNGIQRRIDDEYRARRKTERSDFDGQLNSLRRFSHLYSDAKSYPELQHVNWNNFNQFISRVDGIFNVEQGGEITPEKKEQLEEFLRYVEVVNKAEEYLTPPEVDRALAGRMLASLNGPQEKLTFRGQPISPEITTGKIIDYTDSEGRKTGPFFPVVMEEKNAVGVVIARTVYLLPYTGEVPVGETTVLSDSGVQKWAVPAVRLSYSINGSTEALTTVTEYQSDQEGRIISSSYNVINGEKISGSEKQQEVRRRDVSLFQRGENSSSVIRTLGYSEQVEEPNVSQSIATVAESVSVEMAQMNGMGGIQNG